MRSAIWGKNQCCRSETIRCRSDFIKFWPRSRLNFRFRLQFGPVELLLLENNCTVLVCKIFHLTYFNYIMLWWWLKIKMRNSRLCSEIFLRLRLQQKVSARLHNTGKNCFSYIPQDLNDSCWLFSDTVAKKFPIYRFNYFSGPVHHEKKKTG